MLIKDIQVTVFNISV